MADKENTVGREDINSSDVTEKDTFKEVISNADAFEHGKEGKDKNEQGNEKEDIAAIEKEEAAEAEGKADEREAEASGKEAQAASDINTGYSSYYTPPYYTPNFITVDPDTAAVGGESANKTKKKKKKKARVGFVLAIVGGVLVICLGFIVGALTLANIFDKIGGDSYFDFDDEEMSVIQNAPQVTITQNTDSSYKPISLPEVVSKVGNSVVEITVTSGGNILDRYAGVGAGSGVIITQSDSAGYLLTNYHVVYNDGSPIQNIQVVLTNGVGYSAAIVGSDANLDLALLRIEKKNNEIFTVAQFGDSSKLVVGQDVIAIGNPLGSLGGTVTDGIISALDRRIKIDGIEMVVLQHNAAINPGNSGGALFDMMGNLVGIVNAKTSDEGIEGLGFAIPSNIAFGFLNRIMVVEPALGIYVQYGRVSGVTGLYVVEPAGEFKKYDRIIDVNGSEVNALADYYAQIGDVKKGDTVEITVLRNGERKVIKVVIK